MYSGICIMYAAAATKPPRAREPVSLLVTGVFVFYLMKYTDVSLAMQVPFLDGVYLDFGWINIPILFFIVIGTVTKPPRAREPVSPINTLAG